MTHGAGMGTTGKNLTVWLLLSGVVHGLVIAALPGGWVAPGGPSGQELQVSLGAAALTGSEAPGAPAATSGAPGGRPSPADEAGSDAGTGSATREPQAQSAQPPAGALSGPGLETEKVPEPARIASPPEPIRAQPPAAETETAEIAALTAPPTAEESSKAWRPSRAGAPDGGKKAQNASRAGEEVPNARARAASPAVERSDAEEVSREPEAAPARREQARADAQTLAAAARVSAPAFNPAAGVQAAGEELLALLHREISRHKRYPLLARRQQRQGKATISFRLHPNGSVDDLSVARSSGFRPLDDAALRAVGGVAPFEPAARFLAGAERFEVDVVFTLR